MAKEEGYNISESGNWNVASDFASIKIMKPLDNCDHYQNIALFGHDTLYEEMMGHDIPVEEIKLMGFERLVRELLKLIGNAMFSMKASGTKETMVKFEEELKLAIKIIPGLYKKVVTQKTKLKTIKLNEKYSKILERVIEIKDLVNDPLNKNHLIFTDKEKYDPQKHKKEILERASKLG